jgi:hypothetical protein
MSLVWQNGPQAPADRLMLLALADNADDHGLAWPGVDRLAAKCGVTRRPAQRTLRRLEADGWLTTILGGGTRAQRTIGIPSRYQLNMERLDPNRDGGVNATVELSTPEQLGSQRRRLSALKGGVDAARTINEPSTSKSLKPE